MTTQAEEFNQPGQSIPAGIDGYSFRRAERQAAMVRYLKIILPLTALFLIFLFLYQSGVFEPSHKFETKKYAAEVESIKLGKDSAQMLNAKILSKGKKDGAYELTAQTATRKLDQPDKFFMKGVSALMNRKEGGWAKMTADRGVYNKKTDILNLDDNVKVTSSRGYTANMDKAWVEVKKGRLVSEHPVVVNMPNGVITSLRLEVIERGKIFKFAGNTRMKLKLDNRKAK